MTASRAACEVSSAWDKRGDIVAIMPDGRVVVLDAGVTHPSAPSHLRRRPAETGDTAQLVCTTVQCRQRTRSTRVFATDCVDPERKESARQHH